MCFPLIFTKQNKILSAKISDNCLERLAMSVKVPTMHFLCWFNNIFQLAKVVVDAGFDIIEV